MHLEVAYFISTSVVYIIEYNNELLWFVFVNVFQLKGNATLEFPKKSEISFFGLNNTLISETNLDGQMYCAGIAG